MQGCISMDCEHEKASLGTCHHLNKSTDFFHSAQRACKIPRQNFDGYQFDNVRNVPLQGNQAGALGEDNYPYMIESNPHC